MTDNQTASKTVLVTGGSGYIGSWAIVELLKQGYRVRTTVRSLKSEEKLRAAVASQVAPGDRLTFFTADLLSDSGWPEAVAGVDYVLHIASPMGTGMDLITPAREGTLRVLRASQQAGVKRVVMTSSGVTARPGKGATGPVDETIWTDLTGKGVDQYTQAKTQAEKAAWQFVAEQGGGMTLASVLPVFVEGPVLGKDFSSQSVELIGRLLSGKMAAVPNFGLNIVDVRDVVDLHIRAMTAPEAAGQRFLAATDFLWLTEVARILRQHFGSRVAKIPTRRLPDFVIKVAGLFNEEARFLAPRLGQRQEYSAAKARELLGWQPRPVAQTVIDTAESLL